MRTSREGTVCAGSSEKGVTWLRWMRSSAPGVARQDGCERRRRVRSALASRQTPDANVACDESG
jgi:hypothetical protein